MNNDALQLYYAGSVGTSDYYAPCRCTRLCEYTGCQERKCGFLVQFSSLGTTTTNVVQLTGKACGGAGVLVAQSTGDPVTNAGLTAGNIYRIYPQTINDVLRFTVAGI